MKAEWLANVNGEEYGPFTWDQMLQMSAEGRVTPDLQIRRTADSQWSTAATVPGLLGNSKGAKPAAPKGARPPAPPPTTKKAKPLAAGRTLPPVVTAPPNIPSGILVGAPVGTVVAPAVAPAPPAPAFNFDVQPSASGKMRSVKSVLDEDEGGKKKNNTSLILGAIGGGAALVAVIVGLTIYITLNRGKKDDKLAATNAAVPTKTEKPEGEANPEEANPGEEATSKPVTAKTTEATKKAEAAKEKTESISSERPSASQQLALAAAKSVPDRFWVNAATDSKFGIGNASVSISRIWLAGNEKGERAAGTESPAKYLFVELVITNKAGSALKYKGWNEANKNPLFLLDEKDQLYTFVPADKTPGVGRLPKTDIPGGKAVSDVLVFEAPATAFEKLQVLLPENVFYDRTKNPYFGIEITSDVLGNEGGPPVAVPLPGIVAEEGDSPLVPGRKVPIDPTKPESPAATAPAATTKTDPPPPKKPSLIDEINRSFEEQEKAGKKMDEGKGKAAAEKTPPAKANEPAADEEPAKKPEPAKKGAPKRKGKK